MPTRGNLEAYKCAISYIPEKSLNNLKLSVHNLSMIEMQAYLLTMPYKCGLGMFIDAVDLNLPDALPNFAFEGVSLAHLIDYLDRNGSASEIRHAKIRLKGQMNNPKLDLSGIYTELLVYMTLNEDNGSAELGDPDGADVVWNHKETTYNIECKSIANGFYKFGEPYSPHKFFESLARQIERSPVDQSFIHGYIGAFLLNSRDLNVNNLTATWSAAVLADSRGEPWVKVSGLEKLESINLYPGGLSRPDMVALSADFDVKVVGNHLLKNIMPGCNIVASAPNSRVKWRLMFFIAEDMGSMVERAVKQFDSAMLQHCGRSNRIVFLRLEGSHGPAIPHAGVALPDQTDLKLAAADRAIDLIYVAIKAGPHWAECSGLIVNVPTPALFSNKTALFGGRSKFFAGPAATAPLPDAFRKQF